MKKIFSTAALLFVFASAVAAQEKKLEPLVVSYASVSGSRAQRILQRRINQAVAEYERAAQNGFREVADALVTVEKLKDVRVELEISVQALANAARLSRLRYDTGLANYLEILIADQQLFEQELLLARTRGAQLTGVVQLYRALGGGWQ